MIVVKLELHSAIDGSVQEIGRMIVANDGTCQNPERGNYDVKVGRKRPDGFSYLNHVVWCDPLREGRVEDYPRLSYNVWRLISRAIRSAFPEEK